MPTYNPPQTGLAVDTIQSINSATSTTASAWSSTVQAAFTATGQTLSAAAISAADVGKTTTIVNTGANAFTLTQTGGTITSAIGLTVSPGASCALKAVSTTTSIVVGINSSQGAIGEFGSISFVTSAQQVLTTTVADLNQSTFTLPSAGTWEVTYTAHTFSVSNANITVYIADNANTIVPNSIGQSNESSASQSFTPITKTVYITTTGSTNYKLRGISSVAVTGGILVNDAALRSNTINWEKISGFTPVTGQSVDYVNAGRTTTFTISAPQDMVFNSIQSGNIPLNTTTGVFSLTAGKTYELDATLAAAINAGTPSAGASIIYSWVDAVTNLPLSTNSTTGIGRSVAGTSAAPTFTTGGDSRANIVYTPNVNQNVKVRITAVNLGGASALQIQTQADGQIERGTSFATIKQLGTSAITTTTRAQVVANTMTGVASGGAGTAITFGVKLLDTTNSFNAGTGVFTAPRTAQYRVSLQAVAAVTGTQGQRFGIILSTNGASFGSGSPIISAYVPVTNPNGMAFGGSYIKTLNAGDTLTFRALLDSVTSWVCQSNPNSDFITIDEINNFY